jgi:hypothetical protein
MWGRQQYEYVPYVGRAVISPIFHSCVVLNQSSAYCRSELLCAAACCEGGGGCGLPLSLALSLSRALSLSLSRLPKILVVLVVQFRAPIHDNRLVSLCKEKHKCKGKGEGKVKVNVKVNVKLKVKFYLARTGGP